MIDAFLASLVVRFEVLEGDLNALDAATGDGDHGSTMLKGLKAAAGDPAAPEKAFRRAAGGASGSLFAVVIAAFNQAGEGMPLSQTLSAAVDKITMLGQAKAGDKTMLDALIPASQAETLVAAVEAAKDGLRATKGMAAKRGRAKHVEAAGVGHLDAGATSVVAMLEVYAQHKRDVQ
ncbi:DAK2 domain-containing protein [uncultured Boseongicola sp.]|jgi:dihydroxyacetone kinase-like protein|uniref:DAK2 domain-containing protein n=1 Tax=uncultured Boseongicola sp. TaxID=1648499 RepID=UPI0026109E93|nr:DAK2 domain-containing protein [uncultured Boseongicola sp.]